MSEIAAMSSTTPRTSPDTNTTRDIVVYVDPVQAIHAAYMRALHMDGKVSHSELMEKEPREQLQLKRAIMRILKELCRAPIDEVELLMIMLAMHQTGDVVKLTWRRTGRGQMIKDTYVKAKIAFLRNEVIDEA